MARTLAILSLLLLMSCPVALADGATADGAEDDQPETAPSRQADDTVPSTFVPLDVDCHFGPEPARTTNAWVDTENKAHVTINTTSPLGAGIQQGFWVSATCTVDEAQDDLAPQPGTLG